MTPVAPHSTAAVDPLGDDWLLGLAAEEPWDLEDTNRADVVDERALDASLPGPELADLLAGVDLARCSDATAVAAAAAALRLASWAASVEITATLTLVDRARGWRGVGTPAVTTTGESVVSAELMAATELAAALALSPQSARNRVTTAQSLQRLPGTRAALAAGRIDLVKARDLSDAVTELDDAAARTVEEAVLARAYGRTAAMLRADARRAVITADPTAAQERHDQKVAQRGVRRDYLRDGMAHLGYYDTAENIDALYLFLTARAEAIKATKDPSDTRTLDQIRADVLADIGHNGLATEDLPTRAGRRPQIGVLVPLSTLLGLDDQPGELLSGQPVTAETARRIAADGTWRRLLTDPRTGRFDEASADTYSPPQDLRDHVVTRDRTCRGPGCRLPADRCDLDHRVPHPRGPTAPDNLDAACRPWHRVKTFTDTVVKPDGAGGLIITLPSGRTYHRPPEPVLGPPPF